MDRLTGAFRVLGHPDRLRLFAILAAQGEGLCVCELVEALGLPQYQVSKHLRALRRAGLIESVRAGRWAYYAVAQTHPAQELSQFLRDELPRAEISAELNRLRRSLALRVDGRCVLGEGNTRVDG